MVDVFSCRKRSEIMSRVKSSGTKPELAVLAIVRRLGRRPSRNVKGLPGTPDICIQPLKKAIFVNSCFFHQHKGCRASHRPTSNMAFWERKLDANVRRDRRVRRELNRMGWSVAVVWECRLKDQERLTRRLERFLNAGRRAGLIRPD